MKSIFSKYIDISKIPDWEYTNKVNTFIRETFIKLFFCILNLIN